jgi:glutamate synthase domain-containing protein 2
MHELLRFSGALVGYDWGEFFKWLSLVVLLLLFAIFIYDRFVQRHNQLLINYPLVGRLRYFFHLLRDPMRQYFGDEEFYDTYEKIDWVNKASYGKKLYYSYSLTKPSNPKKSKLIHANSVLNPEEVQEDFHVTFGENRPYPFTTRSIIGRSAMSDGAISPEATQAFSKGAYMGDFPINTGEGSLTTNFLTTHACAIGMKGKSYLEVQMGTFFAQGIYKIVYLFFNKEIAVAIYRKLVLTKEAETYNFDSKAKAFFRVDWSKPLSLFPQSICDIPDIIFQMGSGLYGIRHKTGKFDEERYQKVMRFCKMTEIKIAQGAKQTGGKLLAKKVTEAIAYYRGIPEHQDVISPNRFPYANSIEELYDFIERLQNLSEKPVGFKIVISTKENFIPYADAIQKRIKEGKSYPDFITIDGIDGGSGAAPMEMMNRVGRSIQDSLDIVTHAFKERGIREKVKIIASEKVLTPDDIIELIAYGADYINIARGFMISAGCIRARECSGANGRDCPVGIATMDKMKRSKFLIEQKSHNIRAYHDSLLRGVISLLAIMGKKSLKELSKKDLYFPK